MNTDMNHLAGGQTQPSKVSNQLKVLTAFSYILQPFQLIQTVPHPYLPLILHQINYLLNTQLNDIKVPVFSLSTTERCVFCLFLQWVHSLKKWYDKNNNPPLYVIITGQCVLTFWTDWTCRTFPVTLHIFHVVCLVQLTWGHSGLFVAQDVKCVWHSCASIHPYWTFKKPLFL